MRWDTQSRLARAILNADSHRIGTARGKWITRSSLDRLMQFDRRRGAPRTSPLQSVYGELLDEHRTLAHGFLVNISGSGARLITNVNVAAGRMVQLKLRASPEAPLVTRALIVWSAEGIEPPTDLVGVRHGIRFACSVSEFARIHQFLKRFGWHPGDHGQSFDTLLGSYIETLAGEKSTPVDSFQDLCDSVRPYAERLVARLRSKG